ncbi:MAG: hypothetical protein MJY56_05865 [Bacteroidales bacterium]|nr:hypothetical protein [Bacteroidales bacterium]
MRRFITVSLILPLLASCSSLPSSWKASFENPGVEYRPLKMAHHVNLDTNPEGLDQLDIFADSCGLGGIVTNFSGPGYLKDEAGWEHLRKVVSRAGEEGLRVWIYDEAGYPSLGAGGRVLEADPTVEAKEIVYDETLPEGEQYYVRDSYEYTHATNNYGAARRYPDPGSPRALQIFTDLTYSGTRDNLGPLFSSVEAFFTDGPAYRGINVGQIPEVARKNVPVVDEPDYTKKNLPMAAWTPGADSLYLERYGEPLRVEAIFGGSDEASKIVRQRYWELMGDRFANVYCGTIRNWCHDNGRPASGHFLREEIVACQTPLYGNMLQVERGLDIPGMDMLDTDPDSWNTASTLCWLAAAWPSSAAVLNGTRLMMSEVSEHNQYTLGKVPTTYSQMKATAGCQLASGITELMLYYPTSIASVDYRPMSGFRGYNDYVGRLNSIVREAELDRDVILYYPAYDLQREYIPTWDDLNEPSSQSFETIAIRASFVAAGAVMAQNQIPFILADYLALSEVKLSKGRLDIGSGSFSTLVLPAFITLPEDIAALVESFEQAGGVVIRLPEVTEGLDTIIYSAEVAGDLKKRLEPAFVPAEVSDAILAAIPSREVFSPAKPEIVFGRFERDGRRVYVVVNASKTPYEGTLEGVGKGNWSVLDPDNGEIASVCVNDGLKLTMEPYETLVLVGRK